MRACHRRTPRVKTANSPSQVLVGAPSKLKKVLFVDDSPEYLETLGRVIGAWSQGEWEISLARGSSDAFTLLQDEPADLVVIDVLMPVVDGVQLLRMLHRSHPGMRKVVLTGMLDTVLRNDCLKQGADLFLEKPRTSADLEIVYQALKHVLALEETSGFRGVLRRANIRDIIQMECLNQRSSIVEIATTDLWGEIFIERGNVVHAQTAGSKGGEAFAELVNLKCGEFSIKPYAEPSERTLSSRFEALLLAAAHAWDELLAGQAPTPQHIELVEKKSHDTTTTWFRRKPGEEPTSLIRVSTDTAVSSVQAASNTPPNAAPDATDAPASIVERASDTPASPVQGAADTPAP